MAGFQHIPLQYEPLPTPTSIRLLSRRHRASGDSPPAICGVPLLQLSLDTVDLADEPTYEALSYTWGCPFPKDSEEAKQYGSPNNKWPILVNDRLFFIAENLYNFLDKHFAKEVEEKRYEPFNKTLLIQDAENGSAENVVNRLAGGADVEAQDVFGETALHYAAENGHYEVVKALVDAGSDLHTVDSHGRTPLLCATRQMQPTLIEGDEFYAFLSECRQKEKNIEKGCEGPSNEGGLIRPYETLQEPVLNYLRSFAGQHADEAGSEVSGWPSPPSEDQVHTCFVRICGMEDYYKYIGILLNTRSARLLLSPHGYPASENDDSYIKIIDLLLQRQDAPRGLSGFAAEKAAHRQAIVARSLWVDSICCNQSDTLERNAQVAIMSRIYSQATEVVVWLGREDESTPIVFDLLRRGSNAGSSAGDVSHVLRAWAYSIRRNKPIHWAARYDEDNPHNGEMVQALRRFFSRQWFQRVWVIQELALAREVRIVCGPYGFPYGVIRDLLQGMFTSRTMTEESTPLALQWEKLRDTGSDGTHAYTLTDINSRMKPWDQKIFEGMVKNGLQPISTWGERLSLPALVSMGMAFRATDPRDKIYALLGIAREDANCRIIADYAKPPEELFVDFARYFMAGSPGEPIQQWQTGECRTFEVLEGLSYIQRKLISNMKLQLPTWVPDFSEPLTVSRLWSLNFQAGGAVERPKISPASDPRTLHLQGFCHGEVAHVQRKEYSTDAVVVSLPEVIRLLKNLKPTYPATGEGRAEALWRTWMANKRMHDFSTPSHDDRMGFLEAVLESMARTPLDPEAANDYSELQATDQTDSLPSLQESEDHKRGHSERDWSNREERVDAFKCSNHRYCTTRSLLVTKEGYIGLAPISTRRGDQVWVIPGARTPFILRNPPGREISSHREFVGEAYIHGIMDGEATRDYDGELSPILLV